MGVKRKIGPLGAVAVVVAGTAASFIALVWGDVLGETTQAWVGAAALLPVSVFGLQALRRDRWQPWLALSVLAYGAWAVVAFITMYDFG